MSDEMPIFVKIEEYKNIVDVLRLTQEKLEKAKMLISKIQELKQQEDAELDAWQSEIEDIDGRLDLINKTLLEPEM
ncbi:hypothetical protein J4457_01860 [Candidatus Woesearchaeota archaeon]|nr:hypothetical protein [Candidatus Woesearchaeota archaeon]